MVTRRDFIKLAGIGAAAAGSSLVGLGRTRPGASFASAGPRVVATLCNECPAGCALRLPLEGDRLLDVQTNLEHPLACSGTCPGAEAVLSRLESPARLAGPLRRSSGRGGGFQEMNWAGAATLVSEIFAAYPAGEIAFLLSDAPDHLNDLVRRLALALGGATVLRFTPASLLDGRITLQDAAHRLFGLPRLPYFDLKHSDLVFSFGLSGDEPWLTRFARLSERPAGQAWVHFSPLRPPLATAEDEWVSIRPGSEANLAQALGSMVACLKAGLGVDQALSAQAAAACQASDLPLEELQTLAYRFTGAKAALAVPGASCLGGSAGLSAAQSVLALNLAAGNLGRLGGVSLTPHSPLYPELSGRTATLAEVQSLLRRMEAGQIKALFVHNVDLIGVLPVVSDVTRALEKVQRIISFSSLEDETSRFADALLPDHLPLEGWGYQRLSPATDRPLVSAIQPAFALRRNTRSTADLLLDAILRAGGKLAARLPYRDEMDFIRQAVAGLPWGCVADPWGQWLAQGGWWTAEPGLLPPVSLRSPQSFLRQARAPWTLDPAGAEFYLHFTQPSAGPSGLSALPGGRLPAAIHPAAARNLNLRSGDTVRLATSTGEIDAVIVEQPEIRPDTVIVPLQRSQPGIQDPLELASGEQNESGDLAYQNGRVRVLPLI